MLQSRVLSEHWNCWVDSVLWDLSFQRLCWLWFFFILFLVLWIVLKIRPFDGLCYVASKRFLNLVNGGSSYFTSFCELGVEFVVLIWFLAAGCFFYCLESEKLFFIKILFIDLLDLFYRAEDLLTFWVYEFREKDIDVALKDKNYWVS